VSHRSVEQQRFILQENILNKESNQVKCDVEVAGKSKVFWTHLNKHNLEAGSWNILSDNFMG